MPEILSTGCAEIRVGEASNPGPRNLSLRQSRAVRASPAIESTAVDPTTTVGSMPETHLLTDSDDVESVASSGFLRMFAQDMEAGSGGLPPVSSDTQLDEVQEEVAECRGRHDAFPSRRVVLVPQSPQGTPQSFGDRFSQERSGGLVLSQAVVSAHNAEHSVHEDEVGLPSSDTETVGPVSEVSLQAPSAVSEVVPPVEVQCQPSHSRCVDWFGHVGCGQHFQTPAIRDEISSKVSLWGIPFSVEGGFARDCEGC